MNQSICYLILCHNNPGHVLKIIETLNADDAFFAVHVDEKSTVDFSCISESEHVRFVDNRVSTKWGDISVIDAVLALSEFGVRTFPNAGHYVLLSGADFPVKSHAYIRDYLAGNPNTDYIEGIKLPSESSSWLEGGRRRIEAYVVPINGHNNATIEPRSLSLGNLRQLIKIALLKPRNLKKAFKVFWGYPKRVIPYGLNIYAGEMWWILTNNTLVKILEWNRTHGEYHKFHEDCQIPDEMYVNTLVWSFSSNVSSDTKRYISWINKTDQSPRWLKYEEDRTLIENLIINPDMLFVRKINDKGLTDFIVSKL